MSSNSSSAPDTGTDFVALGALSIMCVCMSLTFLFMKLALEEFSAIETAAGRLVLSALALILVALFLRAKFPREAWFWKWAGIHAILNFLVPFYLLAWGQQFLPTNIAGTYFAFMPLLMLALSGLILGLQITGRKGLGLFLGLIGLLFLSNPIAIIQAGWDSFLPQLAIIAAILCYAVAGILMRTMPKVHPMAMMGAASSLAGIVGLPIFAAALSDGLPGLRAGIGIAGVAILSTAIAFSLRFFIIRRKGPVYLAPNAYISVILLNAIGVIFLGEAITTAMAIAFVLVVTGLLIAEDGSAKMKQV